ncbi:hypothetical protein C8T65DRAFT_117027 [Cerioporus squamosus]|nr:hypothetical protein C8T65DRAFT_117027 [Cerioporus squamosus]
MPPGHSGFTQPRGFYAAAVRHDGLKYRSNIIQFGRTGVLLYEGVTPYPTLQERIAQFKAFKAARTSTIDNLDVLLQEHFGRGYKVRPFGSTCYGAGRPESDLDLCIFDSRRIHGLPPGTSLSDLPPIYDVTSIADVLTKAVYKAVSCIQSAAVPIVKFTDPETGLSCDVNVNHRLGCYKTDLFRSYCLLLPPLAPLLRRVKSWARHVGFNSPSTPGVPTSFSSYCMR